MGSPPHSSMVPRLQPAFAGRGGLTAHPLHYRGGASARRRASDQDLQRLASFVLAEHPGLLGPFQLQLIRAAPWHGAPLAEGGRELRGRVHARGAGKMRADVEGAHERGRHMHICDVCLDTPDAIHDAGRAEYIRTCRKAAVPAAAVRIRRLVLQTRAALPAPERQQR